MMEGELKIEVQLMMACVTTMQKAKSSNDKDCGIPAGCVT